MKLEDQPTLKYWSKILREQYKLRYAVRTKPDALSILYVKVMCEEIVTSHDGEIIIAIYCEGFDNDEHVAHDLIDDTIAACEFRVGAKAPVSFVRVLGGYGLTVTIVHLNGASYKEL